VEHKIRVEVDETDETVGNKVRKAIAKKIPYIVVMGNRELNGESWVIRIRGQEEQKKMDKDEFIRYIKDEIINKK